MICTVHQPNYLPYIGFFEKANQADVFVIYDTTQFKKNDWQNRNRICIKNSWQWISAPVIHNFGQKINEVKIDLTKKPLKKNWFSLRSVYGGAPHFKEYSAIFEEIYSKDYIYIADLNLDLIQAIANILGLKTKFVRNSDMPPIDTFSTQALVDICKNVKADTYISGSEGKNYLQMELFEEAKIKVRFQSFKHPVYKQFNSEVFQPYMSVLDLIFNCGSESLRILSEGQEY